jgi:hypothetical protein
MLKEMLHLSFFCGTKQWIMEHYFNAFLNTLLINIILGINTSMFILVIKCSSC